MIDDRPSPFGPTPVPAATALDDVRAVFRDRVSLARLEASAWAALAPNAQRIGAYLVSYGAISARSSSARSRTLADYAALLAEWDVPGVRPPPDLSIDLSVRWLRSVTLAVLTDLRRGGHLS